MGEDLAKILKDAPEPVKGCASGDKMFYDAKTGGCDCTGVYKCPFQNDKIPVLGADGQVLDACNKYRKK